MSERTPGDWVVHELESRVPFPIEVRAMIHADDGRVVAYRTVALLRSLGCDRADAVLIAAAPSLLEMLRQAVFERAHGLGCKEVALSRPGHCDCWLGYAVEAIARAGGEPT